jgi:hypothetical protein
MIPAQMGAMARVHFGKDNGGCLISTALDLDGSRRTGPFLVIASRKHVPAKLVPTKAGSGGAKQSIDNAAPDAIASSP